LNVDHFDTFLGEMMGVDGVEREDSDVEKERVWDRERGRVMKEFDER
jgi:hypothetical protein